MRDKSSIGLFYDFKLHLIVNDKGEILSFYLTPGNVDDKNLEVIKSLTKKLFGKLFGDKGYLSQKIGDALYTKGIHLITKLRKNIKTKLMLMDDKILLRKRAIIEVIWNKIQLISESTFLYFACGKLNHKQCQIFELMLI